MGSQKSKKVKGQKKIQLDRLSDLPESLILHILSFLDTKYAVQTCILSKRWVTLWTNLPVFKFHSKSFKQLTTFKSYIHHVLDHSNTSNVVTFRIHSKGIIDRVLFDRVIHFAASRGVQEFDLSCSPSKVDHLQSPPKILGCQSIVVLSLLGFNFGPFLNSLDLPLLKSLKLGRTKLYNASHCFNLFSNCLSLQNLVLNDLSIKISNSNFHISAPNLVNLTLLDLRFQTIRDERFVSSSDTKVVVRATKLTSFAMSVATPFDLSICDSPLLDYVEVKIPSSYLNNRTDMWDNCIGILQELGSARSLALSANVIELLSKNYSKLQQQPSLFRNVVSFKVLDQVQKIKLKVLLELLRDSPIADMMELNLGKGKRNSTAGGTWATIKLVKSSRKNESVTVESSSSSDSDDESSSSSDSDDESSSSSDESSSSSDSDDESSSDSD